jgi:Tfp pilus assembly protein PilV
MPIFTSFRFKRNALPVHRGGALLPRRPDLRSRAPSLRSRSGFTLIEALIMIVLVIGGVSAIAYLMTVGTQMNAENQDTLNAYQAANEWAEFLRQVPFDNLQIASNKSFGTTSADVGYDSLSKLYNPQGVYTVAYYGTDDTMKQVTITVSWSRYKTTRDRSVSITTVIDQSGINSQ